VDTPNNLALEVGLGIGMPIILLTLTGLFCILLIHEKGNTGAAQKRQWYEAVPMNRWTTRKSAVCNISKHFSHASSNSLGSQAVFLQTSQGEERFALMGLEQSSSGADNLGAFFELP
jgi:hypothetical protein